MRGAACEVLVIPRDLVDEIPQHRVTRTKPGRGALQVTGEGVIRACEKSIEFPCDDIGSGRIEHALVHN